MAYSKVSWKKYLGGNHKAINKYLIHFGDNFIKQTHQRLKSAYIRKKPEIVLIRFKDSDIVATIRSVQYEYALRKLLNLCIKLEKYELCRDIQNTLNSMQGKVRKEVIVEH